MAFRLPVIVQAVRLTRPKVEIWSPFVSGLANPEAQTRIRQSLQEAERSLEAQQGPLDDPRAEMLGWFETKTNERGVFSISLYNYAYTGGAHGLTLQTSRTFDTATGRVYTLADLFKPGSRYEERLTNIVREQIRRRDIPVFEGAEVTVTPDTDFYIADRTLVLYWQLYAITPYVYGFPYVPISVYELGDIVREDGPLGVMNVND
ncbi:MAG: hypothetical protein A9Z00_03485 [Thermobacillus sp. ZCTH02-B1]|uniref:DUF3298 and DUF4163 domain-containing protein n=1 Tax=Thermobacillus sp. ZCTH02-B1 TaxID=1858795 RepID=UPI000B579884|nr:DUF3298 and DUF4163 domain-containing protein [Thermobacillus sp. ZCTH02-B1]OUM96659.1 MAG: hypothetical protein A9Z00_03485 [Thermobacillus sp. ZCTH02-B1]